jgi:glycyl-tRNA synthetase alpha subunit
MKITSDLTNLTTAILILTVQMFFEWTLCIVRSIEFDIKVGAGTVKACLVLNYRDKRHI